MQQESQVRLDHLQGVTLCQSSEGVISRMDSRELVNCVDLEGFFLETMSSIGIWKKDKTTTILVDEEFVFPNR